MVLFDPPLCKPGRSHEDFETAAKQTAALTRRRSPWFGSSQDLINLVQFMPAFRGAVPGLAELLADATLRETTDGDGYELRCPREYEAQIIDYANVFAVSVEFEEITCPVKVIGADPTLPYSYLPTLDLSDMLNVDYDFLPRIHPFPPAGEARGVRRPAAPVPRPDHLAGDLGLSPAQTWGRRQPSTNSTSPVTAMSHHAAVATTVRALRRRDIGPQRDAPGRDPDTVTCLWISGIATS